LFLKSEGGGTYGGGGGRELKEHKSM